LTTCLGILVVEDDITLRHTMVLQLDNLGLHADSAANGVEAMRRVHNQHYCLILTDIQMPEMNGLEFATAIRSYEQEKHLNPVPIIAVSAGHTNMKQCTAFGINDYLEKPVLLKQLEGILRKWLPPETRPPLRNSGY
jgi:CheY-like chemotaxis protein